MSEPLHPNPPRQDDKSAVPESARQQKRWWGCCACVWTGTWTLLPHPTPPVTDHERAVPVSAGQQERWWGCCACVCVDRNMNVIVAPHPISPHWKLMMKEQCRLCVHTDLSVIVPPRPTPPHQSLIMKEQCLCLQDSKKDDEVAVPVCVQEHERYCLTPPHPTGNWSWKSSASVWTARKMMRLLCLCVDRNMNVIVAPHPTPPVTDDHERAVWSWKSSASVCRTARKMMRLLCLCVHRNMNVIVPPHPTLPVSDHERAVPVSAGQQERWWGCCACVWTGTWTLLSHPTPPHR